MSETLITAAIWVGVLLVGFGMMLLAIHIDEWITARKEKRSQGVPMKPNPLCVDEALAVNEGDIVSIVVDGVDYQSPVVFGWKIVDGQKIPSDLIGAVKLPDDRIILVAVSGKLLSGVTLIERKK